MNVEKNYYNIGQTVEIKLNPSAPSRFYDPIYIKRNSNNGIKTGYIVFLLIALIPVILTVSRMRKMLKNSDTIEKRFAKGMWLLWKLTEKPHKGN